MVVSGPVEPSYDDEYLIPVWTDLWLKIGMQETPLPRLDAEPARGQGPMQLVNVWAACNRLILGQLKIANHRNEITAQPPLLRALKLAGCVVTVDSMGYQKQAAKEIHKADTDDMLALKGKPLRLSLQ